MNASVQINTHQTPCSTLISLRFDRTPWIENDCCKLPEITQRCTFHPRCPPRPRNVACRAARVLPSRLQMETVSTRPSLLSRVRDVADGMAWRTFVEIYVPLLHGYFTRSGVPHHDAADLTQEVLQAVATHAGQFDYDPRKGSFRGWLFAITRNKLRNDLARRKNHPKAAGGTDMRRMMDEVPDELVSEEFWNQEHQRRLFHWAVGRIRQDFQQTTWDAFWRTAVEEKTAAHVARELNISVGAVYIARSRVLTRLRDEIGTVENPN